jgi:cobalt/nickel transport system ATP-binding protein
LESTVPCADEVFRLEGVSFRYLERFVALDDVTLRIGRGELVALLGANGCGKSTLLKLLDGLLFPEQGTVCAFGVPVDRATLDDAQFSRAFRSRVGFVFQGSDAQLFCPTVRDEVAFGPLQLGTGVEEIDSRVDDVLGLLGIAHLADRAPYQLAAGEKKRVAIASVLATNPEVLLLDEPTVALDPRTRQWLVGLITDLHAAGKTIVCATHDLDLLRGLADRCIVMAEDHRIAAAGAPDIVLGDRTLLRRVNLTAEEGCA